MISKRQSAINGDSFPKCKIPFDIRCLVLWCGIEPAGISVRLAVDFDGLIACRTLPVADGLRFTRLEKFFAQAAGGKVMIAFNHDRFVTLRDDFFRSILQSPCLLLS